MDDIVGSGFGGIEARTESKFDMQTVDAAVGELHPSRRMFSIAADLKSDAK